MKIVMINGSMRKQSTYNIGNMLIDKVAGEGDEVKEFFLPRDMDKNCVGCFNCIKKSEDKCPHYEFTKPITEAMDAADVIVFTTPVYVYHCSGALKSLLDHYGYRWMNHRPEPSMFKKQGIVISTAAGGGTKSTNKDVTDSMFFWGVGKILSYGKLVRATSWSGVSDKRKAQIDEDTTKLAKKIKSNYGRVKCGIKTKAYFYLMRNFHKQGKFTENDREYWKEHGWLDDKRPWK